MPGGDRTGPMGAGAMTGRGAGFCAGYNTPGYMNPGAGRGAGFGRGGGGFGRGFGHGGGGRGYRWRYYATGVPGWASEGYVHPAGFGSWGPGVERNMAPVDELKFLKNQVKLYQEQLADFNKRIDEIQEQQKATNKG